MENLFNKSRDVGLAFGITIGFCVAFAVLLSLVGEHSLQDNLTVSLSIGLLTCSLSIALKPRLDEYLTPPLSAVFIIGSGLLAGLAIGSYLVMGHPLLLLTGDQSSLLIGAFFGAKVPESCLPLHMMSTPYPLSSTLPWITY